MQGCSKRSTYVFEWVYVLCVVNNFLNTRNSTIRSFFGNVSKICNSHNTFWEELDFLEKIQSCTFIHMV